MVNGAKNVSLQTFLSASSDAMPVLGYARTAKLKTGPDVLAQGNKPYVERLKYLEYLAKSPAQSIVVVEDCNPNDGIGCVLGDVSCALYKGFGLGGIVTNGRMHDLEDLPEDFPVLAGSIAPSGGDIQVVETGGTVNVQGLEITEGDLVHGDRNGAIVIPVDALDQIEQAVISVLEDDRELMRIVNGADFSIEAVRKFWSASSHPDGESP